MARYSLRLVTLAAATAWTAPLAAMDAAALQQALSAIRGGGLEPERSAVVHAVEIPAAPATLELVEGLLIPSTPVNGATHQAVFLGTARFRFEPDDEIERRELERFARTSVVDVEIRELVLVVDDRELLDRALASGGPAIWDASQRRTAGEMFEEWSAKEVRRWFEPEAAILRSHVDASRDESYLALWGRSDELGSFFYTIQPDEQEQVKLGRFEVDPSAVWQNRLDVVSEIWVQAVLRQDGVPRSGTTGFEARHYDLGLTIPPRPASVWRERADELADRRAAGEIPEYQHPGRAVEGIAKIQLRALSADRRFVAMLLHPKLKPRTVASGGDEALFWFRSGYYVYAVLPAAAPADADLEMEVRYAGEILDELSGDQCRLRSTSLWYPRLGVTPRATYEMTFRWPEGLQLLSSGVPADGGVEGGMRWERRTVPVITLGVSFELGKFDVVEEQIGRFRLTLGFNRIETIPREIRSETIQIVKACLLFYETLFGPHPLGYVTVATAPRGVSQGFLGFVTLSQDALSGRGRSLLSYAVRDDRRSARDLRIELIAHELAHQWWGNKVGYAGYRDFWLSEAMADYSALQFMTEISKSSAVALDQRHRAWRSSLMTRTTRGGTVEELGPIAMGNRLRINHGPNVYASIVYDKGSVVLSMLAGMLGREPFNQMLGALASAADNRVMDTATFLRSIEHMSGIDLDSFARHFVYGTGIPEMFFAYEVVPDGDGWSIEGKVTQLSTPQYRYRLARHGEERWRIRREFLHPAETLDVPLAVPFQIALDEGPGGSRPTVSGPVELGVGGTITVRGRESGFRIPLDRRPRQLWLDQGGQVLARFFSVSDQPKRAYRYLAQEQAVLGDAAAAERSFRTALETEPFAAAASAEIAPELLESERVQQDARIHLALARLYLDQDRLEQARAEIDAAETLLDADGVFARRERCLLRARLELIDGSFRAAYRRLKTYLMPGAEEFRRRDRSQQIEWRGQDAESFVLFAAAAHEAGHEQEARLAAEQAQRRGAELDDLTELFQQGGS